MLLPKIFSFFLVFAILPSCIPVKDFHRTFKDLYEIPSNNNVFVVRTDFSNPDRWQHIVMEIKSPTMPDLFLAYVDFVDSVTFDGLSKRELLSKISAEHDHNLIFICDEHTMNNPQPEILVVELLGDRGRTFRALPEHIQDIENNLSICNMDWEYFSENLNESGVFKSWE